MDVWDVNRASLLDLTLHGPRLFCEHCGDKSVLSPCYYCQENNSKENVMSCRGCGFAHYFCQNKEICKNLSSHNQEKA